MTAATLLIALGGMTVTAGLVLLAAAIANVESPRIRFGKDSRVQLKPVWLIAGCVGAAVLLLTGWVAAGAGAAGAVIFLPSLLTGSGVTQRISKLDGLAGWTRRLADLMLSGSAGTLEEALHKAATASPTAVAAEANALVSRIGPQGMERALRRFAADLDEPAAETVAAALIIRSRHGGPGLSAVLTELAADVEDLVRMTREVEADRAKPRNNVRVLVVLTLGLCAAMALFARDFLAPYSTPVGQAAMAGIVAMIGVAMVWLRRLSRPAKSPGFLVELSGGNS